MLFFLFLANSMAAQAVEPPRQDMDSVRISLITFGPGDQVYSLYGHTAIRVQNLANGRDLAVNYGVFSFEQKNFILRFILGLTDYEMGIFPTDLFFHEYEKEGRWIDEQALDLTPRERAAVMAALEENFLPANRTYRYNYFYRNCTTQARDVICNHLDGHVAYAPDDNPGSSYRDLLHDQTAQHPWFRFGNDLLLGLMADRPLSTTQRQFLPVILRNDFTKATVIGSDGQKRKLVESTKRILAPDAEKDTALSKPTGVTPLACMQFIALTILACTLYEWRRKKNLWGLDAVLHTLLGLAGLVLFAMVFSLHPTVSLNLQILMLNPLALVFLYPLVSRLRQRQVHWWLWAWCACLFLFLLGGLLQNYAEGMTIVALSLLIRYLYKLKAFK